MSARWRVAAAAALFLGACVFVACSGGTNATTPSAIPTVPNQVLSVAGSWNGTSTDSQGITVVEWTITQTGCEGSFLNGSLTMTRR
jgi:hypothetical protein